MRKYAVVYDDEVYQFLLNNAHKYTIKQLVKLIKQKFNIELENKKLAQYCIKMHIKYKYEKINKSHSNKPTQIGTIVTKSDGNYLKIKTDNHKWEYLQRKVYEKYHNVKLKDDEYVIFLNQNRRDFRKENLKVVTRQESAILSNDSLCTSNIELTELACLTAKLKSTIKLLKNENE